jgi:hypothetical protein
MRLSEIKLTGLNGEPISEEDWFKEQYLTYSSKAEWFKDRFLPAGKWKDTPDGISIRSTVSLGNLRQTIELPVKFARADINFFVNSSSLTTMKNFPDIIDGDFNIEDTPIRSFKGGPSYVGGTVYAAYSLIESLEGAPSFVGGNFLLRYGNDKLESLKGTLKIVKGTFNVRACAGLSDLTGSPEEVGEWDSSECHSLVTLKGISPIIHGDVHLEECFNLESLDGLKTMNGDLFIRHCVKLKKVLQVFKIKGCKLISHHDTKLRDIINKYLPTRDVIGCQDELIDAGLEEYARTK